MISFKAVGVTDRRTWFNFLFSEECWENVRGQERREDHEGITDGRQCASSSWDFRPGIHPRSVRKTSKLVRETGLLPG